MAAKYFMIFIKYFKGYKSTFWFFNADDSVEKTVDNSSILLDYLFFLTSDRIKCQKAIVVFVSCVEIGLKYDGIGYLQSDF
jgi:hypothetical protein